MSRRLQEATEEAMLTGGRAGRRAIEDAGFSTELKNKLLDKIADARFHAEHDRTITAAGLDPDTMASTSTTGTTTRAASAAAAADAASSQPWTGTEATEDAVLRMLRDAQKPLAPGLRSKPRVPDPVVVDLRLRRTPTASTGQRLADARDKAHEYSDGSNQRNNSNNQKQEAEVEVEAERAAYRKELRERFALDARAMPPSSFTGLAALANERIEDAIARGQLRDIPRGPGIARDARADNPFIDTTEYIMNKMIQRQAIVPPWIEKQQEVVRAAETFRKHLRTAWRRHAARSIASRGGPLAAQMAQAERYARAEQVHNPRQRNVEQISVPTSVTDDPVMGAGQKAEPKKAEAGQEVKAGEKAAEAGPKEADIDTTQPFRDPQWLAAEHSYLQLSIANLNALTRSYNLMAPDLAKKPYFSLDRELNACYADVAPTLAQTIKDRAAQPARPTNTGGDDNVMGRRVLERFTGAGSTSSARVYESTAPKYGFREMWRDIWK